MKGNSDLPKQFQETLGGVFVSDHTGVQKLLSDIYIHYRHEIMRAAARRAALFIIARYGEGDLSIFPRDMIRLIANEVWKTRLDDAWLNAGEELSLSSSKRTRNV